MVIRPNGEIKSKDEGEDEQENEEFDEEEVLRALSCQVFEDGLTKQRENISHTRCNIDNEAYNVIIDSESCTNL